MTPKQKIEELNKLCNDYREHLVATKDEYQTVSTIDIHNKKLKAIDDIKNVLPGLYLYYMTSDNKTGFFGLQNESYYNTFLHVFNASCKIIKEHRRIDPAGIIFLKAVATVLSLGTVLLYKNFWKSKGEQESDKMQTVLNKPLEIPPVRDRFWEVRERNRNRPNGLMGEIIEAFRSSP